MLMYMHLWAIWSHSHQPVKNIPIVEEEDSPSPHRCSWSPMTWSSPQIRPAMPFPFWLNWVFLSLIWRKECSTLTKKRCVSQWFLFFFLTKFLRLNSKWLKNWFFVCLWYGTIILVVLQGLSLLKASLFSSSALTNGLGPFLKLIKTWMRRSQTIPLLELLFETIKRYWIVELFCWCFVCWLWMPEM